MSIIARPVTYHLIRSLPSKLMAAEHIPVIIISGRNGYFLTEAYEFFHDDRYFSRSLSWRMAIARTIGLFYDFFMASEAGDLGDAISQHKLVRNFLLAVAKGTIQQNGEDPTGLRWKPSSGEAYASRKSHLRTFLEALQDLVDERVVIPNRFTEASISARAYEFRKNRSLLFHIGNPKTDTGRRRGGARSIGVITKKAPFNPDALLKLLEVGCRRKKSISDFYDSKGNPTLASEFNLNLLMATLLMAGGGLRQSELFHIFLEDVRPDVVWMYHPEEGKYETGKKRSDYLRDEYGRLPRNRVYGSQKAGWKSFLITDGKRNRSRLFLLPHYQELFYKAFYEYRRHIYPDNPKHPYLFVSTDNRTYGQPWTMQGLKDAFKAGMAKAGIAQSKFNDTNMHAFRNAYGQALISMNLSSLYIQEAMHHMSIESQKVYTRPSDDQVNEKLQEVAERMRAIKGASSLNLPTLEAPDLIGLKYKSDPAGIFSPQTLGLNNDRI